MLVIDEITYFLFETWNPRNKTTPLDDNLENKWGHVYASKNRDIRVKYCWALFPSCIALPHDIQSETIWCVSSQK